MEVATSSAERTELNTTSRPPGPTHPIEFGRGADVGVSVGDVLALVGADELLGLAIAGDVDPPGLTLVIDDPARTSPARAYGVVVM